MTATFIRASTVAEAVEAMAGGARPVAGGTDLVVAARQGRAPLPETIVSIERIAELHGIEDGGKQLRIGALATHGEIAEDAVVRERFTALADACAIVGSHATRANGTLGGNLMNASPAMETGGPLLCLDAKAVLLAGRRSRKLGVDELLAGPGRTNARDGELLTAVEIPQPKPGAGSCYARLEYRRQMEIAVVACTAAVRFEDDAIVEARVAITAVAPTVRRVPAAESALEGSDGGREAAAEAARLAAEAAEPISDVRASAGYRTAMLAVISRRTIEAAVARARGQEVAIPASTTLVGA
jgi:CO/xanthine dehydrogenase FAD-binding subunit